MTITQFLVQNEMKLDYGQLIITAETIPLEISLPKMASLETQEVGDDEVALPMCDPNYDYYSIDNILEEDILLKVKPLSTILQAHCLRESDNNGTIPSDCEIELPAWIAIPLIRNGIVELIEPKEFNSSFLYMKVVVLDH